MFDGTIEWFSQLGANIDEMVFQIQTLLNEWVTFVQMSTYYVYISGTLLIVLFFMLCSCLHKLKCLKAYCEKIKEQIHKIDDFQSGQEVLHSDFEELKDRIDWLLPPEAFEDENKKS